MSQSSGSKSILFCQGLGGESWVGDGAAQEGGAFDIKV